MIVALGERSAFIESQDDAGRSCVWSRGGLPRMHARFPEDGPVPGGVGPMTIVSLMMNTLKAMELNGK